jgi:hypothetical protein
MARWWWSNQGTGQKMKFRLLVRAVLVLAILFGTLQNLAALTQNIGAGSFPRPCQNQNLR